MIIGGEDDISQYLEDEDVEIIAVKEPFHQQLERELLLQLEEGEQTKKNQQQQQQVEEKEEELHAGILVLMDQQWQEVVNDMAKQLMVMENGASANGDLDVMAK